MIPLCHHQLPRALFTGSRLLFFALLDPEHRGSLPSEVVVRATSPDGEVAIPVPLVAAGEAGSKASDLLRPLVVR
jgi:hypothetical protein